MGILHSDMFDTVGRTCVMLIVQIVSPTIIYKKNGMLCKLRPCLTLCSAKALSTFDSEYFHTVVLRIFQQFWTAGKVKLQLLPRNAATLGGRRSGGSETDMPAGWASKIGSLSFEANAMKSTICFHFRPWKENESPSSCWTSSSKLSSLISIRVHQTMALKKWNDHYNGHWAALPTILNIDRQTDRWTDIRIFQNQNFLKKSMVDIKK